MHYVKSTIPWLAGVLLAGAALAGPPLVCRSWEMTPGSVFEALEPLRATALEADDSPAHKRAALEKLAALRAAIRPDDALSLIKAGYWATAMRAVGVSTATDGPELIRRAVELRPNDAEYHLIAALAHRDGNQELYRRHLARARALAEPGSAAARNLPLAGPQSTATAR